MNLDDMTIGQAKELAGLFGGQKCEAPQGDKQPVLVCTDKRGVVFGYTQNATADPIALTDARMCLYWSSDVGGVFGLADIGPTDDCKISATTKAISLSGITAVFGIEPDAVAAWLKAPVQGR